MRTPLFDPENGLWQTVAHVADTFGLSLCWLLCSLPLFTIGASTSALYSAVHHGIRRAQAGCYVRFFSAFKDNFKTALLLALAGLPVLLLYMGLLSVSYTMAAAGERAAAMLSYAYDIFFLLPLSIWLFACAALARFEMGFRALLLNCAKLAFRHLPTALVLSLAVAAGMRLMLRWPFSLCFLPALLALFASFLLERVFRKYV